MQIYNSLGRKKEELIPINSGNIRIYACGITAYDYCHIGHARSAIVFDVLTRYLRNQGYDTLFIRNFTDIDDKIINRANTEKRDWIEIGETYIKAFHEDMDKLGVQRADLEPRATDYIPQIIQICEQLISQGNAYSTPSGDVYFRARSWPDYAKLSGRNLDELLTGTRVSPGEEKEDPLDFALWKSAKPGEPSWKSPWGLGRPGWHIECSAMTAPHLPLDIHGGGLDLIFPHHENEIAQTEACFHLPLAKYWVHNGFVRIDSEKMSKSLGNFKTIRQILEYWLPETLRFFLLGKHYRSPIDFTQAGMEEAEKGLQKLYAALRDAKKSLVKGKWKNIPLPEEIIEQWNGLEKDYHAAMADDLNTAQAIGHIFSQVRLINRIIEDRNLRKSSNTGLILDEFLARAKCWQNELGILTEEPEEFLSALRAMRIKRLNINEQKVNTIIEERKQARLLKNFEHSDNLRKKLAELGIDVRDTPEGQEWDVIIQ